MTPTRCCSQACERSRASPSTTLALQEDARLLVSRLEERGHFEASVEPEVPEGGGSLAVVFLARPGPRAMVRSLEVTGPPLPPSGDGKGPPELALRADTPYRLLDVARSREALVSAWRRAGHLDARVRPEVTLSEAQDEASVRLVVEPGPRTVVEHLVLAGLDHTRATTVEREMVLRPGGALLLRARAREPAAALRPRHLRARARSPSSTRSGRGTATWW